MQTCYSPLALSLCLLSVSSCPPPLLVLLPFLTRSGYFYETVEIFMPKMLNISFFHPFLSILSVSSLISSSSFRNPRCSALRSNRAHSMSGSLSLVDSQLVLVSSSLSSKVYPFFLNFQPLLSLWLTTTLTMWGSTFC